MPSCDTNPRDEQAIRAEHAEERGQGICRNCLAPIWNEGGTIDHRHRDTGWSDRIERGGDSLVCFKAVEYRHVPLVGREACIYDRAYRRGAAERSDLLLRLAEADEAGFRCNHLVLLGLDGIARCAGCGRTAHAIASDPE